MKETNQNNNFSKSINRIHIIKFIKHAWSERQYGIFVYLMIWMFIVFNIVKNSVLDSLTLENFMNYEVYVIRDMLIWGIFVPGVITNIVLNKFGQKILCIIMGAHKIKRNEHIQRIQMPTEAIIKELRTKGLNLPDNINVCIMNCAEPLAYAVGMNTIIVSEGMAEVDEDIFKAKIITEAYRISQMDPDYLLFMLGSNIIGGILAICMLLIGGIDMFFGSRRSNIWGESESKSGAYLYYGTLAITTIWLGICYLFVRKYKRRNTFEADKYALQFGYGEALCLYLDKIVPKKKSKGQKLLEIGCPSKDERIAALQKAGTTYYC